MRCDVTCCSSLHRNLCLRGTECVAILCAIVRQLSVFCMMRGKNFLAYIWLSMTFNFLNEHCIVLKSVLFRAEFDFRTDQTITGSSEYFIKMSC